MFWGKTWAQWIVTAALVSAYLLARFYGPRGYVLVRRYVGRLFAEKRPEAMDVGAPEPLPAIPEEARWAPMVIIDSVNLH